jgi:hypothetical protein
MKKSNKPESKKVRRLGVVKKRRRPIAAGLFKRLTRTF